MSDWRNQVVFTAIAVAESVIAFAIMGIIGVGIGLDQTRSIGEQSFSYISSGLAPLGWPAVCEADWERRH